MSDTPKLPVLSVVTSAFGEAGRHWRALLKALIIPAVAVAAMEVVAVRTAGGCGLLIVALVVGLPAAVLFAIACHRIVLCGEDSLPKSWPMFWSAREWRFTGWSLLLLLIFVPIVILFFPLIELVVGFLPVEETDPADAEWIGWVWYAPMAYFWSRVCLVLPATAVNQRPRLGDAWKLSRGNGWRLASALVLPGLLLGFLAYTLGLVFDAPDNIVLSIAIATLYGILGAVEVTVISVAFRTLSAAAFSPPERMGSNRTSEGAEMG